MPQQIIFAYIKPTLSCYFKSIYPQVLDKMLHNKTSSWKMDRGGKNATKIISNKNEFSG
jgi:hypothetical protein